MVATGNFVMTFVVDITGLMLRALARSTTAFPATVITQGRNDIQLRSDVFAISRHEDDRCAGYTGKVRFTGAILTYLASPM